MKSSTESSVTSNQSDDVKTVISNTMVSSTDDIDLDDELIVIETEENSSVPEVKLQSGGHTTIMTGTNCDIENEKHVNIIRKSCNLCIRCLLLNAHAMYICFISCIKKDVI